MPARNKTSTATHQSTLQLTQSISLHKFHITCANNLQWHPSKYIELQLPSDLDLINGSRGLDNERRRLLLTPCSYGDGNDGSPEAEVVEVVFATRAGSVTSQIGLPRFRALRAEVLGVGGGFPHDGAGDETFQVAVAGGVGICAFLATSDLERRELDQARPILLWTSHINDWALVKYVIEKGWLVCPLWKKIQIFLTSGTDMMHTETTAQVAAAANEICERWQSLKVCFGRMQAIHLATAINEAKCATDKSSSSKIRFCGGKSLEWQIKLWARGTRMPASVHTTQMQK
jgi:hypothetical protein